MAHKNFQNANMGCWSPLFYRFFAQFFLLRTMINKPATSNCTHCVSSWKVPLHYDSKISASIFAFECSHPTVSVLPASLPSLYSPNRTSLPSTGLLERHQKNYGVSKNADWKPFSPKQCFQLSNIRGLGRRKEMCQPLNPEESRFFNFLIPNNTLSVLSEPYLPSFPPVCPKKNQKMGQLHNIARVPIICHNIA